MKRSEKAKAWPKFRARRAAICYVQSCLEIRDGSVAAGIRRLGREQYKETIRNVLATLPREAGQEKKRI